MMVLRLVTGLRSGTGSDLVAIPQPTIAANRYRDRASHHLPKWLAHLHRGLNRIFDTPRHLL